MNKLSILLVDDEESILTSIKSFLSRRGHTVLTASDGEEGIEKIKNNVIDLVLTDYRMPKKNGLEVLKETKLINPNIPENINNLIMKMISYKSEDRPKVKQLLIELIEISNNVL